MNIFLARNRVQRVISAFIGFALIGGIGLLDYLIPYELSFSTFYIIPLFLIAWNAPTWLALVGSAACALAWSIADLVSGHVYQNLLSLYWNVGVRLVLFVIVAWILSALSRSMEHEKALARIDPLTGAANTRSFLEILTVEIDRSARYGKVFTVAYMDLDSFKAVNDTFGHATGDVVLQTFVAVIRRHMRSSDTVARLGGDEFALIFPETEEKAAHVAIGKIHAGVIEEMHRHGWPVTVSIGSYTWDRTRMDANELIKHADDLMYKAKNSGKNTIVFSESPPSA